MTVIDIVYKNEFTLEVTKTRLAMQRVKQELRQKAPLGKKELEALERFASTVGREVMAGVRAVGITSAFTSGGIVAVLSQVFNALDGFASAAVTQHSVAREVGVTYEQFERFVIAAKATGKSDEEARAGVERMFRAIRNFELGNRSLTRQKLEEGPGGAGISRRFQIALQEKGLNDTAIEIFQRMAKSAESGGPNGRWAAQLMAEALELDGEGWNHLAEMLQKVGKVAVPNEAAARKFLLAQRKNAIAWSALRNRVSAALLPAFSRLLEVVAQIFNEENNQAFIKFINELIDGLMALDWERIRAIIDDVLSWVGNEIVLFAEGFAGFVEDIDKFIKMVDAFRSRAFANEDFKNPKPVPFTPTGQPEPAQLLNAAPVLRSEVSPEQIFKGDIPDAIRLKEASGEDFATRLMRVAPRSTNIIDLRGQAPPEPPADQGPTAGIASLMQSAERLTDQTEELAFEMRRLVDVLRDIREGEGGGSSDGGVSQKARTRPMKTKGGGFGGAGASGDIPDNETPQQRASREDRAAADPRLAVAPANVPAPKGRRTVKASYSNYSEKEGSKMPGGWVDLDDMKHGKPLPSYSGTPLNVPGVAIPYRAAAGAPGAQAGQAIRVWRPDGKGSDIVRVVDTGPNQVLKASQDKGIDINAPLLEKWGYRPNSKESAQTGRPVFPSGTEVTYELLDKDNFLRARQEVANEAWKLRGEGKPPPWHRSGRGQSTVDLNVNVNGPSGVEVDASLDEKGDFVPGDDGVKVHRNITKSPFADRFGDWD